MTSLVSAAPTTADISVHGAAAMLIALRAEFTAETSDVPECDGWADGSVLAVACRRIEYGTGQVIAEPGDLLLVRRDPHRDRAGTMPPRDVAWMPRILTLHVLREGDAADVVTGAM
jgi:hypothetical protein